MAELAGRQTKKLSLIKVFLNSFFEYKMYTHFVFWLSFWLQAAAAVD
jgi:hypothetical protein